MKTKIFVLIGALLVAGTLYAVSNVKKAVLSTPTSFTPKLIGRVTVENGTTTIRDSRIKKQSIIIFSVAYGDNLKRENTIIIWNTEEGEMTFGIMTPNYNLDYEDDAFVHFSVYDPEGSLYYYP